MLEGGAGFKEIDGPEFQIGSGVFRGCPTLARFWLGWAGRSTNGIPRACSAIVPVFRNPRCHEAKANLPVGG